MTFNLAMIGLSIPRRSMLEPHVPAALSYGARIGNLTIWAFVREHTDTEPAVLLQKEMQFDRGFAKAGAPLLGGEDPIGYGADLASFGDQREVELLVQAGFTPEEAIHIIVRICSAIPGEEEPTALTVLSACGVLASSQKLREKFIRRSTMIRHAMTAGILMLLSAADCLAADISGRWEGNISGPDGDFQLVFNFHVEGNYLTGMAETPNGDNPISDGKVKGDHFSFKTRFNDSYIDNEGTISGDTINLKVEGPWGDSEMKLTRAAEKKAS